MIDLYYAEDKLRETIKLSEKLKRQIERVKKYNVSKGSVFFRFVDLNNIYSSEIVEYKILDCNIDTSSLNGGIEISYKKESLTFTIGLDNVLFSQEEINEKKKERLLYRIEEENKKIEKIKEEITIKNNLLESFIFQRASLLNDLLILENGENR